MADRTAQIKRTTKETDIDLEINIDGAGKSEIITGVGFFDHMLTLFSRHGFLDLKLKALGDVEVDYHHTVEDVGICLGDAIHKACGDKAGIKRFGNSTIPMGESLASVNMDLCDRPHLVFNVPLEKQKVGDFDVELVEEFFHAFVNHSGATMHINLAYGGNTHHIIEAVFKAFGRALDMATSYDERIKGVLSTKGTL
ncbi:imidazoleglycerol-phosphate dehydratase HisB [Candidatus Poribacteria bacterium]|nr:imidazoleglycerol-phosphate dehydratase HisB [Candidatus Poribacteria bacterium]